MVENAGLILSMIVLVLLLAAVLLLARWNIALQARKLSQSSTKANYPWPRLSAIPAQDFLPADISREGIQSTIRRAYFEWVDNYILTENDPRRAFLRVGSERRLLKYQYISSSLGQGFALMNSLLMAGEDPQAQVLFDRLLFSCIVRPSLGHEDLTSWQMVPDSRSVRLAADLHAETWIGFAVLAAIAQWQDSTRIDYQSVAAARLAALKAALLREQDKLDQIVYAPAFLRFFIATRTDPDWQSLADSLNTATAKLIADPELEFAGDGANEDASLALQVFNLGISQLLGAEALKPQLRGRVERLVRRALARFGKDLDSERILADYPKGFSKLALLSCCAPAAAGSKDSELINAYWSLLENNLPGKYDPLGASLRVLALQVLAGNWWFSEPGWAGVLTKTKDPAH